MSRPCWTTWRPLGCLNGLGLSNGVVEPLFELGFCFCDHVRMKGNTLKSALKGPEVGGTGRHVLSLCGAKSLLCVVGILYMGLAGGIGWCAYLDLSH